MAVSSVVLTRDTRAAVNRASTYISDFVAPRCVPDGIEKIPGQSAWTGIARRVAKANNIQIPSEGLARAAHDRAVRGNSAITDFTITITEAAYEEAFDTELGGARTNSATASQLEQNVLTRKLSSMILINREIATAALLKNTSVFSQGLDATASPWTDPTTDPIEQLQAAYDAIVTNGYEMPTRLVFSKNYWNAFVRNPYVQSLFGDLPEEGAREAVGARLTNILAGYNPEAPSLSIRIGNAVGSQTNEGQASPTVAPLYDSHCAMLYVPEDVGPGDYVALDQTCAAKSYEAVELYTDSYEEKGTKEMVHRVQEAVTPAAFDATLAYCIRNAV